MPIEPGRDAATGVLEILQRLRLTILNCAACIVAGHRAGLFNAGSA
jgi:hypothetical protein